MPGAARKDLENSHPCTDLDISRGEHQWFDSEITCHSDQAGADLSRPSSRALRFPSDRFLRRAGFHVRDHLVGAAEGSEGAAGLDIGQAFREAGVDGTALGWRVFAVND
jgi:hypothetical protein